MICEFEVTERQLREALAAVELAKSKGYTYSTAVMRLHSLPHDANTPGLGEVMLARFAGKVNKLTSGARYGVESVELLKTIKLVDGEEVFEDE